MEQTGAVPPKRTSAKAEPTAPDLAPSLNTAVHDAVRSNDQWDNERIADADFSTADAKDLHVTGCALTNVLLTGAQLERATLTDVLVTDCELSGASLAKAALRRVVFRNCRMSGIVLSETTLRDVCITTCKLDGANFRFSTAEHLVFEDSSLREGDFAGSAWKRVAFDRCDLQQADFSQASLENVNLAGSAVDGLRGASTMRGVTIGSAQALPFALSMFNELGITVDDA